MTLTLTPHLPPSPHHPLPCPHNIRDYQHLYKKNEELSTEVYTLDAQLQQQREQRSKDQSVWDSQDLLHVGYKGE